MLLNSSRFRSLVGNAQVAIDYPSGYTECAWNREATRSMSGTRNVVLGKSGSFVYAVKTGSFSCIGSAFPSNSYPASAWCSVWSVTSSSSSCSPVARPQVVLRGGASGSMLGATCSSTGIVSISSRVKVTGTYVGGCKTFNLKEGVFRSDGCSSAAKLTNSVLSGASALCIGKWASCTGSGNTGK